MDRIVIDWHSTASKAFLNPRMSSDMLDKIYSALSKTDLKGHFWLATSGTSGFPKLVALSKEAMLISGRTVNHHFNITAADIWLNILPLFHVGGLGIHARCEIGGCQSYDYSQEKWDPNLYRHLLEKHKATWSSLVPTQVFDLIQLNLKPPKTLRGIIIGGGALTDPLHIKAKELGWPLYTSYGMTECCSQVATAAAPVPSSVLKPLEHVQLRINDQNLIEIMSPSLLTAYLLFDQDEPWMIDPKIGGWFRTEDKGILNDGNLKVIGRGEGFLKIGGESIDFTYLEKVWESIKLETHCKIDAVLIDVPDARLGQIIHLAVAANKEAEKDIESLVSQFNNLVLPIAKIRKIHFVAQLPRTPLQKLLKNDLRKLAAS